MRPTPPNFETSSENLYHQTESRDERTGRDSQPRLRRESKGDPCVADLEKVQCWNSSDEDSFEDDSFDGDSFDEGSSSGISSDEDSSGGNSFDGGVSLDEGSSDGNTSDEDSPGGNSFDGGSLDGNSSDEDFSDQEFSSRANFSERDVDNM